jgi:hypothetical protein
MFKDLDSLDHSRKGLNALIWNKLPIAFEEDKMAKNRKIMLDENVLFIYDKLIEMGYSKVLKVPLKLEDEKIIKKISKKNITFVTKNWMHFSKCFGGNFDLIGLPGEVKDEVRLAKAVDSVMRYVAPEGNGDTIYIVKSKNVYRSKLGLKKKQKQKQKQ